MSNPDPATPANRLRPPARTHDEAVALLRRPFAPGAIGFRAMTKVPHDGDLYGGAQVAAFLTAQSVTQRLNAVCPGAWRMDFAPVPAELVRGDHKKLYLGCRLTITLPLANNDAPVDAVYTDIGEMDASSFAGLKALYSDARKRAGVAAGIGAYLYTALAPVVLPIGPHHRQVQALRRGQGKPDQLVIPTDTEQWLRDGYRRRMNTTAVLRDLGPILGHGEPETGMGQGEAAEQAAVPTAPTADTTGPGASDAAPTTARDGERAAVVPVDFAQPRPNGTGGADAA